MFTQELKASARILGVGLLALSVSAPSVLAGSKYTPKCPFSSKEIDQTYTLVGFDPKDPDAGMNGLFDCQGKDPWAQQASMWQSSSVPTFVNFGNETVPAITMDKYILVYVNAVKYADGSFYTLYASGDGNTVGVDDQIYIDGETAYLCLDELRSSRAFQYWVCTNE